MRSLGIDIDEDLYYEGDNANGRPIWPSPTVMLATVLSQPFNEDCVTAVDLGEAELVFREDAFDPMARVRRGRFYSRVPNSGQPHPWYVSPHPAVPRDLVDFSRGIRFRKSLHGFVTWPATQHLATGSMPSFVALGPKPAFTLWRVLSIERIVTGEDLVTLKARTTMGLLPELQPNAVSALDLPRTRRVLDDLVDATHSSGPGSVVDRARDAMQWCIGVWLADRTSDNKHKTEDLGALVRGIPEEHSVLRALGHVIARLHARVKPNEQERRAVRVVTEEDAEYALAAVGVALREIGWAA